MRQHTPLGAGHTLEALVDKRVVDRLVADHIDELPPALIDSYPSLQEQFGDYRAADRVLVPGGTGDRSLAITQRQKQDLFVKVKRFLLANHKATPVNKSRNASILRCPVMASRVSLET